MKDLGSFVIKVMKDKDFRENLMEEISKQEDPENQVEVRSSAGGAEVLHYWCVRSL